MFDVLIVGKEEVYREERELALDGLALLPLVLGLGVGCGGFSGGEGGGEGEGLAEGEFGHFTKEGRMEARGVPR